MNIEIPLYIPTDILRNDAETKAWIVHKNTCAFIRWRWDASRNLMRMKINSSKTFMSKSKYNLNPKHQQLYSDVSIKNRWGKSIIISSREFVQPLIVFCWPKLRRSTQITICSRIVDLFGGSAKAKGICVPPLAASTGCSLSQASSGSFSCVKK